MAVKDFKVNNETVKNYVDELVGKEAREVHQETVYTTAKIASQYVRSTMGRVKKDNEFYRGSGGRGKRLNGNVKKFSKEEVFLENFKMNCSEHEYHVYIAIQIGGFVESSIKTFETFRSMFPESRLKHKSHFDKVLKSLSKKGIIKLTHLNKGELEEWTYGKKLYVQKTITIP